MRLDGPTMEILTSLATGFTGFGILHGANLVHYRHTPSLNTVAFTVVKLKGRRKSYTPYPYPPLVRI
jgi:hypothetical protein